MHKIYLPRLKKKNHRDNSYNIRIIKTSHWNFFVQSNRIPSRNFQTKLVTRVTCGCSSKYPGRSIATQLDVSVHLRPQGWMEALVRARRGAAPSLLRPARRPSSSSFSNRSPSPSPPTLFAPVKRFSTRFEPDQWQNSSETVYRLYTRESKLSSLHERKGEEELCERVNDFKKNSCLYNNSKNVYVKFGVEVF